jgi:hypothetical protein
MKVLMLVISSDTDPVYAHHRTVWRRYMTSHPDIDCFFIQYSLFVRFPTLHANTLLFPGVERYGHITAKTIEALSYCLRRKSYDYVVRTNLSSVWDFKNLLSFLEASPRTRLYSGQLSEFRGVTFASGCGFILSQDVATALVTNGSDIARITHIPDDVVIAYRLQQLGYVPTLQPRVDFQSLEQYRAHYDKIPSGTFHYRMKHMHHKTHRHEEPVMMMELVERLLSS